jgi:hypothetical protein
MSRFATLTVATSETNTREIALESGLRIARGDDTNVAVWPDEHPSAGFKTITGPNMPTVVNDISAPTDRVDVKTRARPYCVCTIHLIAQQSPMGPLKEFKQTGRHSRRTLNWGIRSTTASLKP